MVVRKNGWGKLVLCLMLSLFLGLSGLVMPAAAYAAEISVTVSGDGVANPKTFTQADLEAMPQMEARLYSSINTWPSKKWYMAEGVKLADILQKAGIKDEATLITVRSRDGYKMTFTRKELLGDTRYYYPGLMDTGAGDGGGHLPGSPEGAVPVETILALKSTESNNPAYMNDLNAPLLVFGQRWVTEQTNHAFAKYVSEIEVSTATPNKWEKPTATPVSGSVAAGTQVKLSSPYNDADKVYYTIDNTDPTYRSPMYNWIASRWWGSRGDDVEKVNKPIDINQDMTIKAVVIGIGKEDSDIATFNYQVAPTLALLSAEVTTKGDVSLTFDQAMADPTEIGAEGQFTVLVDGQKVAVNAVVSTSTAEKIKLVLATKVTPGQVVTVAYTKSDDVNKQVKSTDGSAVESFSAQNVPNNLAGPVVFTVDGNNSYTMAQLKAMNPTTGTYTSKNGDISCKGVALKDLLTTLNSNDNSCQVQINTTDAAAYPVAPVSVSAVLDPANQYLLTYEIDNQPITTDATPLRVYWSEKVIKNVTGITIFKEWPAESKSFDSKKAWTIKFSQPVLTTQVLADHIYVINSAGTKEAVKKVEIVKDVPQAIEVLAPDNGYLPGKYTLWIKDSLQSATGKLKQTVKLQFEIAASS